MSDNPIQLIREDNLATLVINRPERRNAINQAMWEAIAEYMDDVARDPNIRALIVTGNGGSFCAGADISEFSEIAADPDRLRANNYAVQVAQQKLEELPRPTIAAIDGACIGGGMGLALACDMRIATTRSVFAITPAKLGLVYSLRDTRRLLALAGPALTKEMLYLGGKFDAQSAMSKGLLNQLVEPEQLASTVNELATQLAQSSQYSIRAIKRTIATLEGYGDLDNDTAQALFDDAFTGEDCQEGVAAFFEKRPADFTWG